MPFPLEFHACVPYIALPNLNGRYPALTVSLRNGANSFQTAAILDSGAQYTVFQQQYAEMLGIDDLERGDRVPVNTFGGPIVLRQFQVEMKIELPGFEGFFQSRICFPEGITNRNILGRIGFFDRLCLGFRERKQQVYVASED